MYNQLTETSLSIHHKTTYQYSDQVDLGLHTFYLHPRSDSLTRLVSLKLYTIPEVSIKWGRDPFENIFATAPFSVRTDQLQINVETELRICESNPFDFILDLHAVKYPFPYSKLEKSALSAYFKSKTASTASEVLGWIYKVFPRMPDQTMDVLLGLNQYIFENFRYQRREEEGIQTPNETLLLGSGSCRDFSWLFLHACQEIGFPARFVSGYVSTVQEKLGGSNHLADRAEGSMHAWVEVYLPGAGWKGFDPTNGIMTTASFVSCAVSSSPESVSPIQGSFGGRDITTTMTVDLSFSR